MKNNSILIDSDVLIWWLRGRKDVVKQLSTFLSQTTIYTTPVTVAEIWAGVRRGEEKLIEEVFKMIEVITVGEEVGKCAGEFVKQYRSSHKIELGDALIAACASIHKMKLWTFNVKHYPMLAYSEIFTLDNDSASSSVAEPQAYYGRKRKKS